MKKLFILLFAILTINVVYAQGCLPEGITFSTQAQIDSFQIYYPGCTEIEGNVEIYGDDIINLTSLNVLTKIGGDIWIHNNNVLASLTGLENLNSIAGELKIGGWWPYGNNSLQNLMGLDNLTNIGGTLLISNNPVLESLIGLDRLTSVGGNLQIGNGDLKINNRETKNHCTSSLKNLTGLDNLVTIAGTLVLECSDSLTSLKGLEKLDSVGGLSIYNPFSSINELENLSFIGNKGLTIAETDLTSLEGLENVTIIEGDLRIFRNEFLNTCDVTSICNYLGNPNGIIEIQNNAPGCNSKQEVLDSCDFSSVTDHGVLGFISFRPNPFTTSTTIEYELTKPSTVQLTIYDFLGKQVEVIERSQAQGKQQIIWNAEGLPAGVYHFRLQAGEQMASGKLMVVR